ncbi:MAG TPA: STAS domain-containing protein [bacterium]|nr:STAS domain-containing protein [bacterium]
MELKIESSQNEVLITVKGDVNYDNSQDFYNEVMRAIQKENPLIKIDLSGCKFLSSNGIGTIAAAATVSKSRGGELVVTGLDSNVRHLFKITLLDSIVDISD